MIVDEQRVCSKTTRAIDLHDGAVLLSSAAVATIAESDRRYAALAEVEKRAVTALLATER